MAQRITLTADEVLAIIDKLVDIAQVLDGLGEYLYVMDVDAIASDLLGRLLASGEEG